MNEGMLWFDNDPKTSMQAKVERAVEYYAKKYFRLPDLVFINPKALQGKEEIKIGKIAVRPYRSILPGHFWIGNAEK